MSFSRLLFVALGLAASGQAVTLVAHGQCTGNPNCSISSLNTTGTKTIVVYIGAFNVTVGAAQITSTSSIPFTCKANINTGNFTDGAICWALAPATSTSETITFNPSASCVMIVAAFDFVATAQDKYNFGFNSGSSPLSSGSITPSANSLVIAAGSGYTGTIGISTAGFTQAENTSAAANIVAGLWYQVGSTAVNPQLTMPGVSFGFIATVTSFKPPVASGAPTRTLLGVGK